jgi:hypothetical protein
LDFTPWTTELMRSRPAPVSIDGAGSGVSGPSATLLSNCMNTRFQISSQPFQLRGSVVGHAPGAPSML